MSEAIIRLIYHGPAVENGTMNVKDLASALVAFADLCHQANRVLNRNRTEIQVSVHSDFKRGSFGIDLAVILNFLGQKEFFDTVQLAYYLVGSIVGLVTLRKLLKGEEPKKVTAKPDGTIIINNNIIATKKGVELSKDSKVRRVLEQLVKLLEKPGYDALEIKTAADPVSTRIEKNEIGFFRADAGTRNTETIAELEIVRRPASKGGKNKWTLSDGTKNYKAQIADRKFLQKAKKGEISVGSKLKVRLRTEIRKTKKGRKTNRRVTEVLEINPGSEQFPLMRRPRRDIEL